MISAKVIADSITYGGHRLTTLEVNFHRFILAEVNTHRLFSRNSASSRAIPIEKQINKVINNPAMPIRFGSNQPGMQAGKDLEGKELEDAKNIWLMARDKAVASAIELNALGIHKQLVNRILEPFMWHTAIISATDFAGFFEQRISNLAQPEIEVLAIEMKKAIDISTPEFIKYGSWHLPYLSEEEKCIYDTDTQLMCSVARCARVSYLTHDGVIDINKDIDLYNRLTTAEPPHWSPLEHVATTSYGRHSLGNFTGWHQLRHMV